MSQGTSGGVEQCPCFAPDVDPETINENNPDGVCACGHAPDEHDSAGQCQAVCGMGGDR